MAGGWWENDQVAPPVSATKNWWESDPLAKPEQGWGDYLGTAAIRGAQAAGSFLADPLAPLRTLVSPELAKIEQGEAAQAKVPPPAEIVRRTAEAAFPALGVKEYQPQSPREGLGQAALTGTVAGAPFGPVGMLVGGAGGALGYGARQAMGEPKPGEVDWTTRAEIAASLLPGGVANRLGVRARSRTTPELEAAGVNPTFGQAMGGALNKIEQALSSIPFIGDAMQRGRAGATEEFNRGAINRSLEPLGERLDPNTPLGRPAIDEAETRVGNRYDQITPQLGFTLDPQFGTGLTDIFRRSTMLSRDHQTQFTNTFRNEVMDRLNGSNMTGQAFRDAESTLGQIARENRYSSLPADRAFGNLVTDLQGELRANLRRSNPDNAAELTNIHRAYTDLARVELAAARMGTGLGGRSEHGVFTPSQLTSAVRQMDPTLRNRGFARGDAPMQDYAEAGRRLLGDTVPDSGTPYRMAVGGSALGGAGLLANPMAALGLGAGYVGSRLAYSPQGRAAMNYFLRRPEQAGFAGLLATQDDNLLPPLR